MKKLEISVDVKPLKYEIYIGDSLFPFIARILREKQLGNRYAIITDSHVKKHYSKNLLAALQQEDLDTMLFDFPAGENSKNRTVKNRLDDCLLENSFGRDSAIIALGGGVVGDIAGFVAATYMRGIPYIQIPTTTISQADSSIGGKTAIDVPQGKNLIGAFHQPDCVFIDVSTLVTLDDRNYRSGMIEVIKHGIIRDAALFDYISENRTAIFSRKAAEYLQVMTDLMHMNCQVKNNVVARDSRETNLRKILNYGHTIGHAVELLSGFRLLHGEAVSIGIAAEAFFSHRMGFCTEQDYLHQVALLKKIGLPVKIPRAMTAEQILQVLRYDKKARNSIPQFVQVAAIGRIKTFQNNSTTTVIEETRLLKMLNDLISLMS